MHRLSFPEAVHPHHRRGLNISNRHEGYIVIMIRNIRFRRPSVTMNTMARTVAGLVAGCCLYTAWPALAEVAVTGDEQRTVGLPVDYGSLGDEGSSAGIECWQQGKEIFSDKDYNTVLLGALASESAITLKNNRDGAQTLAISLDESLCFVTITP